MKQIGAFLLLFFACIVFAMTSQAAETGKITVHVTGLNNDKGSVRIALFNTQEGYSAKNYSVDKAVAKAIAPIKSQEADYVFENIPYGEYGIRLFHDEDNSGVFYTKMFGIPKVQYGFSNNAKGMMGPPSWDKVKFMLNNENLKMTINTQGS